MTERDERLAQFFSGYFNQDWDVTGAGSWSDVLDEYLSTVPRSVVDRTRDDLRGWLDEAAPGCGLPAEFGCDFDPRADGMDEREWVKAIADYLEVALGSR